jgi:NitT/TauT family transport system permease protein
MSIEATGALSIAAARKSRRSSWLRLDSVSLLAIIVFVLFLVLWEFVLIPLTGMKPFLLPPPSEILPSLWNGIASGYLPRNAYVTLEIVAMGFVTGSALGFLLAIPVAEWRSVERILSPYIIALQAIPKVAIAPLLIIWFGYGLTSKVVIAGLITFFPVFVNSVAGMRSTPHEQLELFRIYRASRWQRLRYLSIPNSATFVFAGLNVGVTLSLIGAIVAEFVGAQEGLGSVILRAGFELNSAGLFAALVVLTAIAAILTYSVQAIGQWVVFWARPPA